MDAAIADQDIAGLLVEGLRPKGVRWNESRDPGANLRRFAMLVVLAHDVAVSGGMQADVSEIAIGADEVAQRTIFNEARLRGVAAQSSAGCRSRSLGQ